MEQIEPIRGLEHLQEEDIERLIAIDGLLRARNMPIDDLERASKVNAWNGFYKDNQGESHKVTMAGIELRPDIDEMLELPSLRAETARITPTTARGKKITGLLRNTILPDMQLGWAAHDEGYERDIVPIHDEMAINTALARIKDTQPDRIVMNGDNLDFPMLSTFSQEKRFQRMMQYNLNGAYYVMAKIRAVAPNAEIKWLEGNHEERLQRVIGKNVMELMGIKRPKENQPILSIPHMLQLSDLDIDYLEGYPANAYWLNKNTKVVHGDTVNSRGSTAAKICYNSLVNVIFGHIHRREYHQRRIEVGPNKGKNIVAVSFGTLARLDGFVSSHGSSVDSSGKELKNIENWGHGIGEVFTDDERTIIRMLEINDNYELIADNKIYNGTEA